MSEKIDLPAGSTVSADGEAIHFMDSQGRMGEITEYGVAIDSEGDYAESEESNPEYPEAPARDRKGYDYDKGIRVRTAGDVYGSRGQVPKVKK